MSAQAAPIIEAVDVHQRFADTEILRGISLSVHPGEIVGLLGPNGAGKSTTVDLLAGLTAPSSGSVRVLGVDPARERATITAAVGVQPQQAALFPILTVDETLALFASFHERPAELAELRARVQLDECRGTQVRRLSGGETRRLLIAIALIGRPRVVILDEPAAGLDPASRLRIAELIRDIRAGGTTVLLTTHHLDDAQSLCDQVLILVDGSIIAQGAPAELARTNTEGAELSFSIPADTPRELLTTAVGDRYQEAPPLAGSVRVSVRSADPDQLLRRITFTRGLHASGIAVREATLEDVYLRAVNGEP
ncbi:ABC transporter ATP-binding protein [Leucobacter chromiireducens]|uniref:ABC transporter ATP-binding protein n=1 Tax=Leucobacter chromiireducens TaxID=283877 RepID=UPI0013DE0E6E|nr:ABC transporter ATP-binding protein [Leucobacter chromiireducens]